MYIASPAPSTKKKQEASKYSTIIILCIYFPGVVVCLVATMKKANQLLDKNINDGFLLLACFPSFIQGSYAYVMSGRFDLSSVPTVGN
jgi:hypothetical protein